MHFLQHHLLHFYHFVYHFVCLFTTSFFTTTCHLQPPFLRPLAIYNHLPFTTSFFMTTCHLQPAFLWPLGTVNPTSSQQTIHGPKMITFTVICARKFKFCFALLQFALLCFAVWRCRQEIFRSFGEKMDLCNKTTKEGQFVSIP